jgi:hypothetical protein
MGIRKSRVSSRETLINKLRKTNPRSGRPQRSVSLNNNRRELLGGVGRGKIDVNNSITVCTRMSLDFIYIEALDILKCDKITKTLLHTKKILLMLKSV